MSPDTSSMWVGGFQYVSKSAQNTSSRRLPSRACASPIRLKSMMNGYDERLAGWMNSLRSHATSIPMGGGKMYVWIGVGKYVRVEVYGIRLCHPACAVFGFTTFSSVSTARARAHRLSVIAGQARFRVYSAPHIPGPFTYITHDRRSNSRTCKCRVSRARVLRSAIV